MENQVLQIAERIRGLREIIGKSVGEMAEICGVSEAEYRRAENGEYDFSFTFLHKCAKAFGIEIEELLTGDTAKLSGYSVVRRGEGTPLTRRKGFKYQHLATYFKSKYSEPFLVCAKYDPEEQTCEIPLSTHEGEEFDYILKGSLKVCINGHVEVLHEGDAIYYDSSVGHGMIAAEGGDCEFLAVVIDAKGNVGSYTEHAAVSKNVPVRKNEVDKGVHEDFIHVVEDENGALQEISFQNTERFNFGFDVVDKIAQKNPDKLAMQWVGIDGTEKAFTFSDMSRLSNQAANYFKSLGIKKGDRVMLVLKRHYQFWISIVALHKIGAIVIPATNQLVQKDFEYRFQAAGVSALLCTADGDVAHQAELAAANCPELTTKLIVNGAKEGWREFDKEFTQFPDTFDRPTGEDEVLGSDRMLMYFTSGTTGYPKIAAHDFTYPLGHYVTAKYWHNVEPDGLHFAISDTGWGKAVWGKLYGQWLCEAAIFTFDFDRFHPDEILPMFAKYNITTFCAPPTMYRFFIQEDLSKYDLSSLHYCTIAGEALNPEVFNKFYECTGIKLMEGFGQTETTLTVANLFGMEPKPGSMGKPNPQYHIDIVNDKGESVKTGETGEIVLRTDKGHPVGMFIEYYRDPEKTKEAWHDDLYHTGDMAWRDEDGYFWYVGRTDDLIKSSGYRIGPFEIESVLMEHDAVMECAVTAVPDPLRGQAVKATIVLTKRYTPSEELKKDIQNYVKEHTAPYKYPRVVEFVEELPKTISGKIRRVEIRETKE